MFYVLSFPLELGWGGCGDFRPPKEEEGPLQQPGTDFSHARHFAGDGGHAQRQGLMGWTQFAGGVCHMASHLFPGAPCPPWPPPAPSAFIHSLPSVM